MSVMAATVALLLAVSVVGLTLGTQARQSAARSHREATRSGRALRLEQYARDVKQAFGHCEDNLPDRAREVLERLRPAAGEEDLRGFTWHYLYRLCHVGQPPLLGHRGEVYDAVFSPDGRTLATAGQDRTARLWDVATGQIRRVFEGKDAHTDELNWVSISPDGRTLATASDDKTVKIWNAQTGRVLATLAGHAEPVVAAIFSPDGRHVISCGRTGKVCVWETATFREIRSFPVTNPELQAMAISPDGSTLAIAGHGTVIRSLVTGRELARLDRERGQARCAVFSHNGQVVATCGRGAEVELWETGTWRRKSVFQTSDGDLALLAFSPDDQTIAAVGVLGLIYMLPEPQAPRSRSQAAMIGSGALHILPMGRSWRPRVGNRRSSSGTSNATGRGSPIPIPTASISSLTFSQDRAKGPFANRGGRGSVRTSPHHGRPEAAAPGRCRFKITVTDDQGGRICDVAAVSVATNLVHGGLSHSPRGPFGVIPARWRPPGTPKPLPCGNYPPAADSSTIRSPASMASGDLSCGQWVARSGHHDTVFLWNAARGGEPKTFARSNGDAQWFSHLGRIPYRPGVGDGGPTSGTFLAAGPGQDRRRHRDHIASQAFSPDGSILATGDGRGTIILWISRP